MGAAHAAPQSAALTFEAYCRRDKELARHALRSNWQEQKKVEALWRRFSSRLEALGVAPCEARDLERAVAGARSALIATARASAERAAIRVEIRRLRRAHTAARHYERSLRELRLPFLSRDELDRRAANWLQASERLDLDYGDNEVMRAAYAIYGPKGA
ncbi:hypothetical protein DK26_15245 [Bosea sp. WAO]|uniref:hypothetical protein n=1 Tax=Bosea sp. WAO TaxID=406341 RepID=UPI00074A5436|nr:hypothetical protein [Bosea sp. WAO]KUL94360.1 hypothetical protein DK26_15245 [Bosea sp. WAO]